MEAVIKTITPEIADKMLLKNFHNRPITPSRVNTYAEQMAKGLWRLTHEGIAFDKQGNLIDGQHRLLAVKKSGASIQTLVFNDCDGDTFDVINIARARTAGDVLAIAKIPNYSQVAASARHILLWEKTNRITHINQKTNVDFTNQKVLEFVQNNPRVLECTKIGHQFSQKGNYAGGLSGSQIAALVWFWQQKADNETIEKFLLDWKKGANLDERNPIYLLRETLRADVVEKKRMVLMEKYAYVLKAWELYRKKKTASKLIIGSYSELSYPELKKYFI